MELERFKILIEAYGGNIDNWPAAERNEARAFLLAHDEAGELKAHQDVLDRALDLWKVAPPSGLKSRILARLPARRSAADRFVDWLFPEPTHPGRWLWRPALIATLPLVLGIIVGSNIAQSTSNDTTNLWQEEIYLMAVNVDNEETSP